MTIREKILVTAMCLAIVFGILELYHALAKHDNKILLNGNPMEELKKFVSEVSKKLVNEKITVKDQYMITQAGEQWTKDPFIYSIEPLKKHLLVKPDKPQDKSAAPLIEFTYSGYLELGNKKLAIINGMEYAVGETITAKGYYVKRINAHRVEIAKINGLKTIWLPLRETDIGSQLITQP